MLHDAGHDIRTPTHELTISRDVLRTRRRIATQPAGWALSPDGLRTLRLAGPAASIQSDSAAYSVGATAGSPSVEAGNGEEDAFAQNSTPFDAELAAIDAVLARSEAAIEAARTPGPARAAREKDSLVYVQHPRCTLVHPLNR